MPAENVSLHGHTACLPDAEHILGQHKLTSAAMHNPFATVCQAYNAW